MHAPQVIWMMLIAVYLTTASFLHGTPKTGTHNVWAELIACVLEVALLWWGGFFG